MKMRPKWFKHNLKAMNQLFERILTLKFKKKKIPVGIDPKDIVVVSLGTGTVIG